MEHENDNFKKSPAVFSKTIRAGRRRTYFFDVRTTRGNDYYITLTESKRRFNDDGYDRHKIFLYKEDFNKFLEALNETINHVKEDLLPEYDFDEFSKDYDDNDDSGDYDFSNDKKADTRSEENADESSSEETSDVSEPEASSDASDDEDLKWD